MSLVPFTKKKINDSNNSINSHKKRDKKDFGPCSEAVQIKRAPAKYDVVLCSRSQFTALENLFVGYTVSC